MEKLKFETDRRRKQKIKGKVKEGKRNRLRQGKTKV